MHGALQLLSWPCSGEYCSLLHDDISRKISPLQVKYRFLSFLFAIGRGDGEGAARHLLGWTATQRCPDPEAFIEAMRALSVEHMNVSHDNGIDLDAIIKRILLLVRHHAVSVDAQYASLLLSACIIVGFASGLDSNVNLMDAAIPAFVTYNLTGRFAGRLYT
jgi:predicted unusual protein kinase regulating ubiquinone biosynthesis (AarF/ABC1/UbiB family)